MSLLGPVRVPSRAKLLRPSRHRAEIDIAGMSPGSLCLGVPRVFPVPQYFHRSGNHLPEALPG